MAEASAGEQLKQAVEGLHGCRATSRKAIHVHEVFKGQTVWEGEVHIFDLDGHSTASCCYAWSAPVEGSDKRRFYAVLHDGPVKSAADAVRASISQRYHESGETDNV